MPNALLEKAPRALVIGTMVPLAIVVGHGVTFLYRIV